MKKTLVIFFLVLLLTGTLLIVAFAHGGKTDNAGGHFDHDSGEYHYHHGYPAHSHYDVDGDGYIDCPYDFDDKTNHGSGTIDRTPETTKKPGWKDLLGRTTESTETEKSASATTKEPPWQVGFVFELFVIFLIVKVAVRIKKSKGS